MRQHRTFGDPLDPEVYTIVAGSVGRSSGKLAGGVPGSGSTRSSEATVRGPILNAPRAPTSAARAAISAPYSRPSTASSERNTEGRASVATWRSSESVYFGLRPIQIAPVRIVASSDTRYSGRGVQSVATRTPGAAPSAASVDARSATCSASSR